MSNQPNTRAYENLLREYKEISLRLNSLLPGDERYVRIDQKKNDIHNNLKREGLKLGKSEREVFADIMGEEENLASDGLPEFSVANITQEDQFFGASSFYKDEEEDDEPVQESFEIQGEFAPQVVSRLRKGEFVIIFAEKEFIGLIPPNTSPQRAYERSRFRSIPFHLQGVEEKERRAVRFAKEAGCPVFRDSLFSHNYARERTGVVVNEENFYTTITLLRDNRDKYGIREEDLDPEVVERDWERYKEELVESLKPLEEFMGENAARYFFEYMWNKYFNPDTRMLSDKELLQEMYKKGYISEDRLETGFPQYQNDEFYNEYIDRKGDTEWTLPPEDGEENESPDSFEEREEPLDPEALKNAWLRGETLKRK